MGFGTFDGLHPGHLFFLRQLKSLGDELYIAIGRDRNVKRIKGKKPYFNEKERQKAVEKTGLADKVLIGHSTDFYRVIHRYQPDVIGLGYDQRANTEEIQTLFPSIKIITLKSLKPEKYKSSLIKKRK